MMSWSSQCYIPSFKAMGFLVLERKISEDFLPYMDVAATLVMWRRPREKTSVSSTQLYSKIWFQSALWFQRRGYLKMLTGDRVSVTLNKGQRMTFSNKIYSSGHLGYYIYQLLYIKLKQFLRNQLLKHFRIQKHNVPQLILPYIKLRATYGHHLYKIWWAGVLNAAIPERILIYYPPMYLDRKSVV